LWFGLQTQFGQSWVLIRAPTQGPTKESIFFSYIKIVDAGVADSGEPCVIKFPILISIRSMPLAGRVVRLVGEADSNPASVESPELLYEAVV
jgi:hypothetical protein